MARRGYHHEDLRSALVEGSFALLAESGVGAFSVAALARRLGVSTAAPYRHFRDRDDLLAAVAARAASELATGMRAAADAAGDDPVDRFAATAGAYVDFVSARGAGFDIVFDLRLRPLRDGDLAAAGRELMGLLLDLAGAASGLAPPEALLLLEQHVALAHGYASINTGGLLDAARLGTDDVTTRAVRAARALVRGHGG